MDEDIITFIENDDPLLQNYLEIKPTDLNLKLKTYNTYLNLASSKGSLNAVKILLKNGANPDGKTPEGYGRKTPLYEVNLTKNTLPIIKDLLRWGADINLTGTNNETLLFRLVATYDKKLISIIEYILSKGANPNLTREYPPLFEASQWKDDKEIILLLLYFGANPNQIFAGNPIYSYTKGKTKNLLTESLENTLDNCEDNILLKKIARSFKIPLDGKDLSKKDVRLKVCQCIRYMREHKD